MTITKKDLKEQSEEIKRHTNVLYEKFHSDVKVIGEQYSSLKGNIKGLKKDVNGFKEKQDVMFDTIGEMKQDIEIMKSDIAFIKTELRKFVRVEEFQALEKRVLLLERKFSRI